MVERETARHYHFQRKIGEGSFGEVWLADDPRREQQVAVKLLRLDPRSPNFSEAVSFFKHEFELLSELRHLHLARVLDFGFDPEREKYFLSAEYFPGKTLLEALENQSVDYFEEILVQILSALDYIHSQGIIHFDIKPENILIEEKEGHPFAKLLDFGVAGRLNHLDQGRGGSPAYMAPELFGQNSHIDHRADLYSLGVLCLEALTGDLPFDRRTLKSARDWHLQGRIPEKIWKGRVLPGYLLELVRKLLAKKPSDRFSNARVVLNFLNLATSGKYQKVEAELQSRVPVEGPLVERREGVLDEIQQRIQNLFFSAPPDAASSATFICGERGIGKSRILEEIQYFLALKEIRFFKISCDWQIPSWPRLAEALELGPLGHDDLDEAWQIRRRVDALKERAGRSPVCLLIDDFQKAESDLKKTILNLGRIPFLFVAVATEEKMEGGIHLKRLSRQAIGQYVGQVLGRSERIEEVADLLDRYSGGLPLLMVEALRYLMPHFHRGESLENLLTSSSRVALFYQESLKSLAPAEEELLHLVALLFRPVPESEILRILKLSAQDLAALSKNCIKKELLSRPRDAIPGEMPGSTYAVSSQALALELIERIDPERRRILHGKIAQGLQETAPPEEIAYHLSKAGQTDSALQFYEQAGRAFKAQGQIASAIRCFSESLKLTPEGSPPWRNLIREAVQLSILSGNYPEAQSYLEKMEAAPTWEAEELKGRLAFKRRQFSSARKHCQTALQLLGDENLLRQIALENVLAGIDLQEGFHRDAAERFKRSLALEQSLPPEDRIKIKDNNLGTVLGILGNWDEAIRFFEDRLSQWEGRMSAEEEVSLLNGWAFVCLQSGRYDEAVSNLKKAMLLAEQSGAMHSLSSIMGNLITALLKESRYAESLPLLRKIVAFQKRLGSPRDVAYSLLREGSVYLLLGMGEAAKKCFESGKQIARSGSDQNLSLWYLLVEGYWERECGDFKKARALFQQMEAEAVNPAHSEILAWALYAQADQAYEQKNIFESRRLLSKIRISTQDKEFLARLHLLEAKLSATEKGEDADKLFAGVESECLKGHYREILWEVYHDWALIRERRQGPKAAQPLFEQGVHVVEAIVGSLPEEYRHRYLNQRMRKKLFQDWKNSQSPPLWRLTGRIKEFLRLKIGRTPAP